MLASESQHTVDPWRRQDGLPAFKRTAEENVTGEEGKGQLLVSIFPAVNSGVKREKCFEPFIG
jgi:hypothetical protein